jgi:hypothetical protein
VKTHPNLTSRVWAGWPSVLPCRSTVSFFTPVLPSRPFATLRIGIGLPMMNWQVQLCGSVNFPLLFS